ncbi:beta-ketoacyl synthase chain length factor [Streptomyces sp. NPDC094448]|uniref:beta-ketoacyl synthase chain length factor n=1 Tax=Streptomyces sp. NPDC094448 TaxID=3366063 RepID=UPI003807923F
MTSAATAATTTAMTGAATAAGLTVLARAGWDPAARPGGPPNLPGFTASPFGPLFAHVADRCLTAFHGTAPAPPEDGRDTGLVLVSRLGDMATETAVTGSVDRGTKASPLLFYQSVPSAVLGVVSARWGLGGPVICISPAGDPWAEGLELAGLLAEDGSARDVLVVLVELGVGEGEPDSAEALLVRGAAVAGGPAGSVVARPEGVAE